VPRVICPDGTEEQYSYDEQGLRDAANLRDRRPKSRLLPNRHCLLVVRRCCRQTWRWEVSGA